MPSYERLLPCVLGVGLVAFVGSAACGDDAGETAPPDAGADATADAPAPPSDAGANPDGAGGALPTEIVAYGTPRGVSVDATHVYWSHWLGGGVFRAPIPGGPAETLVADGQESAHGAACFKEHVYFGSSARAGSNDPGIYRVAKVGGAVELVEAGSEQGLNEFDGFPYWPGGTGQLRMMGPTGPVTASALGSAPNQFAVADGFVYLRAKDDDIEGIDRVPMGTSMGSIRFATAPSTVVALAALAADSEYLYWIEVEPGANDYKSTLRRRRLDTPAAGGDASDTGGSVVHVFEGSVFATLAVDDVHAYVLAFEDEIEDVRLARSATERRRPDEDPPDEAARSAGHRRLEGARLRRVDGHLGSRGRSGPRRTDFPRSKVGSVGGSSEQRATTDPRYSAARWLCTSAFSRASGRSASSGRRAAAPGGRRVCHGSAPPASSSRRSETTLLIDPFVTRPGPTRLTRRFVPDDLAIARHVPKRVTAILCGHSHYDHVADAPRIAADHEGQARRIRLDVRLGPRRRPARDRARSNPAERRARAFRRRRGSLRREPARPDLSRPRAASRRGESHAARRRPPLGLPHGRRVRHPRSRARRERSTTTAAPISSTPSSKASAPTSSSRASPDAREPRTTSRASSARSGRSLVVPTHHDAFFAPLERGVFSLAAASISRASSRRSVSGAPDASVITPDYEEPICVPPEDARGSVLAAS